MKDTKTLVIYGDWLLKKLYFRNHSMVCGVHGHEKCGAFVGFLTTLKNNIEFLNPTKVIVVWDGVYDGWFKYNAFPDLKLEKKEKWRNNDAAINSLIYTNGQQEQLAQIWSQRILIQECLEDLCIRQIEEDYSEAYDVIAHYAQQARLEGEKVFLYGREFDYFQLISDQIYCIVPNKDVVLTVYNFKNLYGYDLDNEFMLRSFVGANSSVFRKMNGISRNRLLKFFPELKETHVPYKEFIQLAEEKQSEKKLKIYEYVLGAYEDLKVNSKVLNLSNPHVNEAIERLVDSAIHSQMDLTFRNIELVKSIIKDRGMAIHINGSVDHFFSSFERIKLKEKQYQDLVNEKA